MSAAAVIERLESLRDPEGVAGMARFGITPERAYGVRMPVLRQIGKEFRPRDKAERHALAAELWQHNIRETRILASIIEDPSQVTEAQMDAWTAEFDNWEVCDQCCMNLYEKMPNAYEKAIAWSHEEAEFVKRAGFVLMARLAVSDKKAPNDKFEPFLKRIEAEAGDSRNFVKKGVNWALRQIGKRNLRLNQRALQAAESIAQQDSRAAQWVARDAIKELESTAVQTRLQQKESRS